MSHGLRCPAEAVPKRILDAMNVEGLTRENVASHLQVWPDERMNFWLACPCAAADSCSTACALHTAPR